jgi:hypothetical protein
MQKGIEIYPVAETGIDVYEYGDPIFIEGGVTGPKGDPGDPGAPGEQGPQGEPGVDGADGEMTVVPLGAPFDTTTAPDPNYTVGSEINYLTASTADVAYFSNLLLRNISAIVEVLQTSVGEGGGMRGAAVFTGTGPPPTNIPDAQPGDVYLDTTTGSNRIYVLGASS